MKILHVNNSDFHRASGTSIAMHRLHTTLCNLGIDSHKLVQDNAPDDPASVKIPRTLPVKVYERVGKSIVHACGLSDVHIINTKELLNHPLFQRADLLHLHCIHEDYFNYRVLPLLTSVRPAILTVHDMWVFTGGCHHSYSCTRWQIGCGACPQKPRGPRSIDNTALEWRLKFRAFEHSQLEIVAPSRWMARNVEHSILGHFPIHYIPHGLDMTLFQPYNRAESRARFGLPPENYVILCGSARNRDPNKGYDLLVEALCGLPDAVRARSVLLLIGDTSMNLSNDTGLPVVTTGYLYNTQDMALAYSAADLFVSPSKAETFGLTLLESLACGTPVVAFDNTAIGELVMTGTTGYLAQNLNPADLSRGIVWLLEDEERRSAIGHNSRELAVKNYTLRLHAERHIHLYEAALKRAQAL